jgi:hypothetical protein
MGARAGVRFRARPWLGLAAAAAVITTAQASAADLATEGTSSRRESPRALNEHVFQPSTLLVEPFSTTSFGMTTRFGSGTATAPRFDRNGNEIGSRSYDVGAYGIGIDLSLLLTPDIALRFNLNGVAFTGLGARGILVAGATVQAGASAGITAGRDLGRTTRLSFIADFGIQPQFSVLIANAVLSAIQTRLFDDSQLLQRVERLYGSPGVSFAWAPAPYLGFVAEARYTWTRRVVGEEVTDRTAQGASLGALASFDFDPLLRFPIALQASYRGDLPVESSSRVHEVHQAGLGVFYTRRVRLALGFEAIWRHGDIRPGVPPSLRSDAAIGSLTLRYYW